MIVDSHVYCFPAPDTPAGHPSTAEHLDSWQRQYALHHQPAFRVRDRAPSDSRLLLDPTPVAPLRLAADRNFRVDRTCNRLVWTVAGEDYTKQQLPPNVIEFGPGAVIAEMDHAGIDWALIHVDATLTKDPAYLSSCVAAFPQRLRSMAPIDEWLIPTQPDTAINQAVAAVQRHGLHALKIIPAYAYQRTGSRSFGEPAWRPFWDAVAQLGVPVFFTLGASPGSPDPRQGYIEELWRLRRWHDRYPHVTASVTHGYPWREFLDGRQFALPDAMWAPFHGSNLCMEVGFPFRIGDLCDYPYRECWPVLEAMVQHIGPNRLLWGTDMPFQNRFCTYRQSRDYLEKYSQPFLSSGDLAKITGGTAARVLGIKEPAR
jgi:predicted TIM-barrel fold metal-dependent hydrolase